MSPGTQVLLSGALTFGIPLAIALREVFIHRPRDDGGWGPGPHAPPPKPLRPQDDENGRKKLPACLLPPYPPLPGEGPEDLADLEDTLV